MRLLAHLVRRFRRWRCRVRGMLVVTDIPTDAFGAMIRALEADGWTRSAVYRGVDAGIDYDRLQLRREGVVIACEWDNYAEGRVEGPEAAVRAIAARHGLRVPGV